MIEDRLLIWRLRRGSRDALRRVYQKHAEQMLSLATGMLGNLHEAEDVVHDVFVAFARSAHRIKLSGSLKAYFAVCVTNKVRDRVRARRRQVTTSLEEPESFPSGEASPDLAAIRDEELCRLARALMQLPNKQREVVVLRLHGGMKFRQIAELQETSINTVQGRYRYGLDKLRSLLDSEIQR